jgi:hypothetical protein
MTAPDPEGSGIRPVGVFQFNTPTRSLFYINFRINNVRSRAPLSLKAEAPTIFLWAGQLLQAWPRAGWAQTTETQIRWARLLEIIAELYD